MMTTALIRRVVIGAATRQGFGNDNRDEVAREFDAWLAGVKADVLRGEIEWFENAHANSANVTDADGHPQYTQTQRDAFGWAIGWLKLHLTMMGDQK